MKFKREILPSGLRIVAIPMKDNPTATVLVMVEAGSKYETKNINGLSHFLEHMCFKGTTKRPTALDISRELDSLGSQSNAFTSQEYTGYYAKAEARHLDTMLDVVSDLYLHPLLPATELEKEKGVIIEEINMYEDLPSRIVHDVFMELLYGDQPVGWSILGPREVIRGIDRATMLKYRNDHYVSEATTVVVAGNINETKVIDQIGRAFGPIGVGKRSDKMRVVEAQAEPRVKVRHKETDQAHLVLGVRSFDTYSEHQPVLRVIEGILGRGMSSRLFQKLREEMGVCYYVRASEDSYTDHGIFQVSTGVDTKRIKDVIRAILEEFNKLKNIFVSDAELKKVKDYLVGTMMLEIESSDAIAEFFGYQEILRKSLKTPLELAKEIEKVTPGDIERVSKLIFEDKNLNLAVVGPYKDSGHFNDVLHF